jgi:hypothetical protein
MEDLLPALTGLKAGKEYMTIVNNVQQRRTTFEMKPKRLSQNGPRRMFSRPRRRRQMTGIAYDTYRRTTLAVTILCRGLASHR